MIHLAWDRDAEIKRILAMTDDEIRADCEARGVDMHAEAEQCRAVLAKIVEKCRRERE